MLILLTFRHFYMTKSEALTSDFVDSLRAAGKAALCYCGKRNKFVIFLFSIQGSSCIIIIRMEVIL